MINPLKNEGSIRAIYFRVVIDANTLVPTYKIITSHQLHECEIGFIDRLSAEFFFYRLVAENPEMQTDDISLQLAEGR